MQISAPSLPIAPKCAIRRHDQHASGSIDQFPVAGPDCPANAGLRDWRFGGSVDGTNQQIFSYSAQHPEHGPAVLLEHHSNPGPLSQGAVFDNPS